MVLTGAGISTESGIPDYRGPSGASMRKHAPMTYQAFRDHPVMRHRYWARSFIGWPLMRDARPNAGHEAVAHWERLGLLAGTITQNVDRLHTKAGSARVIDLHGNLGRVSCLSCSFTVGREELQSQLADLNHSWAPAAEHINPDGDADIPEDLLDSFTMLACPQCGGPLKPDVVYFGESVPVDRVEASSALVSQAHALFVLGSSLTVYSGRRFVISAHKAGIPIVIVNQGPTRCDDLATLKIEAPLGSVLREFLP